MASNNAVKALLKPEAQHGRNQFPLDNKQVYSIKAGQITPVKCLHFKPNDYFDIQVSDFSLTFPMQTAPFLRGRKEFAMYSVYYNAIWSVFNQYQSQRLDPKTSAFIPKVGNVGDMINTYSTYDPSVTLWDLYKACLYQWLHYEFVEFLIPYIYSGDSEALVKGYQETYLYKLYDEVDAFHQGCISYNGASFGNTSEHMAQYSIYVNSNITYEPIDFQSTSISSVTVNDFAKDIVGHWRCYNYMRKLDMLGYGNIYPLFASAHADLINNLAHQSGQPSVGNAASAFAPVWNNLFNYLWNATHDKILVTGSSYAAVANRVNVYPICAYNLIFYHFFRNPYFDTDYCTHDFNLDFVLVNQGTNFSCSLTMSDFSFRFLDIEYHQWKKDTFTAVLPDTQFGSVSSITTSGSGSATISGSASLSGTTGSDTNRWFLQGGSVPTNLSNVLVRTMDAGSTLRSELDVQQLQHTHTVSGTATINSVGSVNNIVTHFDVIALKRAEMLQQYRQQLMRAGNRTSDVFKAIYGTSPSSEHEDDIIPRFLDTFGEDIFVDPVTATANTGSSQPNGQLGDLASRGKFSGQSGHIKFNSGGNFGILMLLTYVVPTAEYNSYMIDKHVQELTPQAHYISQFDNYGLEPIYTDELNNLLPRQYLAVLGFGPAYHHKKSQVDMVHGAFCSLGRSFLAPVDGLPRGYFKSNYFGEFNNWVSPRSDLQARTITLLRDFYINPSVLDNVFVRAAGADQADDQFICNTYLDVKSTREMSTVGLINFV